MENKTGFLAFWNRKSREIKQQVYALYYAYRDPRVPWYAKGFIALVVAYAFSPIDLIPDFIPVLGYLDDFVVIPLGVVLAIRMIPADVMMECQARAKQTQEAEKPQFKFMGAVIIVIWVIVLVLIGFLIAKRLLK